MIEPNKNTSSSTAANTLGLFALVFFLLLYLYWNTLVDIAIDCWNDDNNSHGILLPFITAYVFWDQREIFRTKYREANSSQTLSILGACLMFCGVGIYLLGIASDLIFVKWFSFYPVLAGVVLLVWNSAFGVSILAPLLLNYMAKPFPNSLIPKLFGPMQSLAAKMSAYALELLNVPVYLSGNIVEIPGLKLFVEEACSGLRSVTSLVSVAAIVILLIDLPKWLKGLLLVLAVIIALALNIIRVVASGLLAHFVSPELASGFFHSFSGMIVFICGLGILYWIGKMLARLSSKPRGAA